jgi:hypothetical protein
MRTWRRAPAVDSHDASSMRFASLRTRFLRVLLVAAALSLLVLATASARGLQPSKPGLEAGSTGVLVIDLSLSIGAKDYEGIRRTVRRLIADKAATGLVIFSDVSYELLPPGTPASELRPLLRLLKPRRHGLPVNPWSRTFRAGTRISSALELARDMLVRDHVKNGYILLVSDLITAPEDIPQLVRTLQGLHRQSIDVRVVPLSPLSNSRTIFEGLLGKRAFLLPSDLGGPNLGGTESRLTIPGGFLVLAGLLLAVLAAHERFAGRLGLPFARRGQA